LSQESLDIVRAQSKQLARGIAEAHGCTAEVDFQVQYPVTVNDGVETEWTLDQVRGLLGEDRVEVSAHPIMPSEDFSFVLHEVPGTYMMLGAKRTDVPEERQGDNHSPFVIFDDSVLGDQAALLAHLALERLRTQR
ncbi:MAG: M20/M25/M40 family metallo-hydrolase, partial [Brevibacterium aurantiacum]